MKEIVALKNVSKWYDLESGKLQILKDISFEIHTGEVAAIVGPSGSGKTTLLGIMAGLDKPSNGEVFLDGSPFHSLTQNELAAIRSEKVGFVFQNFQLIGTLTALDNVMIPMELQGNSNAKEEAKQYLETVGLANRMHHYPKQLSGGEQQRVAIARAFAAKPKVLFADEPTGNLDEETGLEIENLLFTLNRDFATTLILVTHDMELAAKADKILRLKGGLLHSDKFSKAN